MYLDIHAHFAEEGYEFPHTWEQIRAADVQCVVLAGDNVRHSRMHRDFAQEYAGAYFTAGVHPSCAGEDVSPLEALCAHEKCVAVGEVGLDYHYPTPEREVQRAAFIQQIELAHRVGLPLQIHSRDAAQDTLAILKEAGALLRRGFLLHCYSYGRELLEDFLALGAYFSFGGVTCFSNARRVVESAAACPKERILSETDSPYLSPFRGQKNTPANIPVIVKRLAEVRGEDEEALKAQIANNAGRLFPKLKLD